MPVMRFFSLNLLQATRLALSLPLSSAVDERTRCGYIGISAGADRMLSVAACLAMFALAKERHQALRQMEILIPPRHS